MNTLKTIQTLSKIGKILSKIVFICCVVAFCGCIATIISLAFGAETLRIGGLTLKGIFQKSAETSIGTVYAAAATGLILSAGEAVLAVLCKWLQALRVMSASLPGGVSVVRACEE